LGECSILTTAELVNHRAGLCLPLTTSEQNFSS
jgi:hypothetical protein